MNVGIVEALFRYPIKSMGGEPLEAVDLGWHGLDGDRRLALRRAGDRGGFPWLTATKLSDLVRYVPVRRGEGSLPSHVRTPQGEELPAFGPELADEVARAHGSPVEMTHLSRGVFDEASVSVISTATIEEIGRLARRETEVGRFRPNVVIASPGSRPFEEDDWIGGILAFGDGDDAPAIAITNRDERCAMVNLDPVSGCASPEVLKAIVRERDNKAGVYATVIRRGRLAVGQRVFFEPSRRTPTRPGAD
jgi:uncharacterized protein YcbX